MNPRHPRNQVTLLGKVVFAVIIVFAVVLYGFWSPLQPIAPAAMPEARALVPVDEPSGAESLEPVEGGLAVQTPALPAAEGARISASEPAAPSSAGTEASPAAEPSSLVRVELVVQGDDWLAESVAGVQGSLSWRGGPSSLAVRPVSMTSRARGTVELESVPKSQVEFTDIHLAGMVFRPTGLSAVPAGESEFAAVLEVEPVPGATFVWSAATPADARLPVDIALLGKNSPLEESGQRWGMERGRAPEQAGCRLPYTLPRLVKAETVWVGREGRVWRAFPVTPDDLEVSVQLAETGVIRVLHDGPGAAASGRLTSGALTSGGALHAILQSFPSGSLRVQPVVDGEPILFDELSMGEYRVWLALGEDTEAERASHEQRLFLDSSEIVEADLTQAFAREHLGGVRLYVTGSDAAMQLAADVELEIVVARRSLKEARWPWVWEGSMRALEVKGTGERVFHMGGLPSGEHALTVRPMGTRVTFNVDAGQDTQLDLRLADPGWMKLRLPEGYDAEMCIVSLSIVESGPETYPIFYSREVAERLDGRYPLTPGTYRADIYPLGGKGLPSLACPRFAVRSGEECLVAPEPLPDLRVSVEARNVDGGSLVALSADFWTNVAVRSVETGEQILGITSFVGASGAHTGIEITLAVEPEMARFEAPESLFWSFEPIEPLELRDGMTVVLRATAK